MVTAWYISTLTHRNVKMMIAKLNKSNLEHALIAIVVQAIITAVACALWGMSVSIVLLASLPAIFLYFGREHAQYERKLKDKYSMGESKAAIEGLKIWNWTDDGKLDFICPAISCVVASVIICAFCT